MGSAIALGTLSHSLIVHFDVFVQLSVRLIAACFLDLFARRNPQIMNERNRVFKEKLGFEGVFR